MVSILFAYGVKAIVKPIPPDMAFDHRLRASDFQEFAARFGCEVDVKPGDSLREALRRFRDCRDRQESPISR